MAGSFGKTGDSAFRGSDFGGIIEVGPSSSARKSSKSSSFGADVWRCFCVWSVTSGSKYARKKVTLAMSVDEEGRVAIILTAGSLTLRM